MLDWSDVRDVARACRTRAGMDLPVDQALAAALAYYKLEEKRILPSDGLSANVLGAMERSGRTIYIAPRLLPEDHRFIAAHELGHFLLHKDPRLETKAISYAGEAALTEGYSARSFVEAQADTFATEFLCPAETLRAALDRGDTPSAVAAKWGLSPELVLRQTIRVLLQGEEKIPTPVIIEPFDLEVGDAARLSGHVLVEGDPGSGKTTACIARVVHLLDATMAPASIVALSSSEAAARRLRAQVIARRESAGQAWFGTIRGLACEILAACPSRAGRSAEFVVLDDAGSLVAIEAALADARAQEAKTIPRATDALRTIKHCKRAGVAPSDLKRLRHQDVAPTIRIWRAYEQHLAESDSFDIDDVVPAATAALQIDEVRRHVRARFDDLVIDEFEELFPSEHLFAQTLADIGVRIFAAGEAAASIQRYRGACPQIMRDFEALYAGGRRVRLPRSRRRPPAIEDAIDCFLKCSVKHTSTARRQAPLAVSVSDAADKEAAAILRRIESLRAQGTPYGRQAILARSHQTLTTLAAALRSHGVPLMHLGDLGEERTVRDLVAVAALVLDNDSTAFAHVATLSIYDIDKRTVAGITDYASRCRLSLVDAMQRAPRRLGLHRGGGAALERLVQDVMDFPPASSPWLILTTWLFERSDYFRQLVAEGQLARSELEAAGVLLGICGDLMRRGDNTMSSLRKSVARFGSADHETRVFGPSISDGTDRVRMMTIHAAKGASFAAVHIPALAAGRFPLRKPARRDLVDMIIRQRAAPDDQENDERALFSVALTRAERHLHLSRARAYGRKAVKGSPFLDELGKTAQERRVKFAPNEAAGPTGCSPKSMP